MSLLLFLLRTSPDQLLALIARQAADYLSYMF